ncbi:hypothetical protein OEZ85_011413 [Tetradesmus obliquus]|uniref:histidine kinase n=1 Tax=Tetradesmus obliquus TaxID=3088 RepID=A0ABY8TQ98_TETOB|nr:hypothetical protein OEZ85_011413 [Tetradesmus obliquus]
MPTVADVTLWLVCALTHDLRAPINGMLALVQELLHNKTQSAASRTRMLHMIRSSATCLLNTIDTTLSHNGGSAGGAAGQHSRRTHKVYLWRVCESVLRLTRPMVKDNVRLINCISRDMPPVKGDSTRLMQVLLNLVCTCLKFTHAGDVRVSASQTHSAASVVVADTGQGIPPEQLAQALDPFQQAGEGADVWDVCRSGLGLYLVQQALSSMGSSIAAASEPGRGSSFCFELPLADSECESESEMETDMFSEAGSLRASLELADFEGPGARAAAPRSMFAPDPSQFGGSKHTSGDLFVHGGVIQVLSVDDDPVNQLVASTALRSHKWEVVKCMSGAEALAYLERSCAVLPDLVLLDVMMPAMSGYEVAARLRTSYPSSLLPIIMVSAKTEEADIVQGLRCGADDYITKPFKRAELAARIRAHIRARDAFAQQQAAEQAWLMQHNLLPPNVQRKLRAGETVIAESHPQATVLWAEVVGGLTGSVSPAAASSATPPGQQQQQQPEQLVGTHAGSLQQQQQQHGGMDGRAAAGRASCERVLSPAEAVVTLNSLYTTWEELCGQRDVLGVDFSGSTFVAVSGHDDNPGHLGHMLATAEAMLGVAAAMAAQHEGCSLSVRLGLHTGPITTGLVGSKAVKLVLMGDTVEVARLLASSGCPLGLHISAPVSSRDKGAAVAYGEVAVGPSSASTAATAAAEAPGIAQRSSSLSVQNWLLASAQQAPSTNSSNTSQPAAGEDTSTGKGVVPTVARKLTTFNRQGGLQSWSLTKPQSTAAMATKASRDRHQHGRKLGACVRCQVALLTWRAQASPTAA